MMIDILLAITIAFVLLRLVPSKHWLFHMPIYLMLQTTVTLTILVFIKLLCDNIATSSSQILVAASGIIIILQAIQIWPYFKWSSTRVQDCTETEHSKRIKLLVSNVLISNKEYDKVIKMAQEQDADVVALLEIDSKWTSAIKEGVSTDQYPNQIVLPREDGYGIYLLSKHTIKKKKVYRIHDSTPALEFTLQKGNDTLNCFLLHPKPPVLTEAETSEPKDAEFEFLGSYIGQLPSNHPVVVFGDLNDVAWSKATKNFLAKSGMKDPRIGRGIMPTFPAYAPFMGFPLDQVFVSDHFGIHELKPLPDVGSDHFPLLIDMCYSND